jgi:peptidyl-prolyl cis-trans isomerase SurA
LPDKRKSLVKVNNSNESFHISQIFIALPQDASANYQQRVKDRMDSIYDRALKEKSFDIVANDFKTCGMQAMSSKYVLSSRNKTYKEVEQVIYDLKKGEISKPFLSPAGYYIVKVESFQPLQERIEPNKINVYLLHEYEDGLLSQEFMKVSEKISEEEYQKNLINYFNTHKKDYSVSTPCFEGLLIQCKTFDLAKRLKKKLKKMPVENRMKFIRTECNTDSILLVKATEGFFTKGDNPIVDKLVFKGPNYKVDSQYPYTAIIGKKKKRKQFLFSEVKQQVEIDYQETREKNILADLRQKYDVQINKSVLDTVNKHL